MSQPRSGPDPENLRKLAGMLPTMVAGLEEKRIGGRGTPVPSKKPTKICIVCGIAFDSQAVEVDPEKPPMPEEGLCDGCWEKLQYEEAVEDGKTIRCCAVVCDDVFSFMVSSGLGELAGKIVEVPQEQMMQVAKQHKIQKKVQAKHAHTQE